MQPNGLQMFDARQFEPKQGMPQHPPGKFPAIISDTSIQPTSTGTGGMFVIEFTTQSGKAIKRYNLWNNSADAVRIAQNELSALCHAVGIYQVDPSNQGAALRNAQLVIEVGPQRKNPEYNEVVKVYDRNGNEPGKGGGAPQPQPPQGQPQYQPQPGPQGGQPQGQPGQTWTPNAQPGAPGPGQPYQPPMQPAQPAQPGPAPGGQWGPGPAPGPAPQGGQPPQQPAWNGQPQGGQPQGQQPGGAPDWSQGQQPGGAPWGQR